MHGTCLKAMEGERERQRDTERDRETRRDTERERGKKGIYTLNLCELFSLVDLSCSSGKNGSQGCPHMSTPAGLSLHPDQSGRGSSRSVRNGGFHFRTRKSSK